MQNINLFSISGILVVVTNSLLAIFLFWRDKKTRNIKTKIWGWLCILTTIWGVGVYKFSTTFDLETAIFWRRIANIGVILTPVLYYHFIYTFLSLKKDYFRYILITIYTLAYTFLSLNLFFPKEYFVGGMSFVFNKFYYSDWWIYKIPLYLVFYISFYWILLGFSFLLLVKSYKRSSGIFRNQIKYFIVASVIGWLGPILMWSIEIGVKLYPYSNLCIVLYPLIFTYAILKYRLMDINVVLTRFGIFSFVYALVLGIPFWIGYTTQSWLPSTAIMFLLASTGPLIYTRLRRKAENLILAQQKRYQKTLIQAAQGMVKIRELKRLINLIVHIVTKAVRVDVAAIFRFDKERKVYKLEAYRDRELFKEEVAISHDHPIIEYLLKTQEALLLEDIPFVIQDSANQKEIKEFFERFKLHLVIPSLTERDLLGILALGSKPNKQVFTEDDINVFKILAHQASLAIENCLFLEEFKKTQEKIFHADKLATVGAMAEGVSHQLNNRLQAFAAVAGDLKDVVQTTLEKENPENLRKDLEYCLYGLDKIEKNVLHSAQIIRGILNYARTEKDASFRFFDINEIINVAVDLLGVKHNLKDFKPSIKVTDGTPKVWGSPAQLSEAVFNLIDNAYEAIEDKQMALKNHGNPQKVEKELNIELQPLEGSLLVKVSDNGIGIAEENKSKMFAPFYTTKSSAKSGTGLGMYVIKRIVEENHRGKIWFESEYMKGSTFYMELPTTKR